MSTSDRSIQRRQRQREFNNELPEHCCPRCSGLIYHTEAQCLDCGMPRPDGGWLALHAQHDPWLGRILDGRYLVTKRVGEGASGTVYRGYSTSIHREFGIKVVEIRSEDTRNRLAREIEVMGSLKNPHIVPFYEVMEVPGNMIVVMDFIHGRTLQDLVSKGPLSEERVISLGIQIANGLHEAHGLGLVHRDLKPANIMVETLPAGDDFAHVLDFGIVKTLDSGNTAGFIGTPMFSSPEQVSGESVDARSDIYSLGLVMFFAVTGELPFDAPTVLGILQMQISDERPHARDVNPGCSEEFDALLFELMARAPAHRPKSMAEVAHRLERLRQHRPAIDRAGTLTAIARTTREVEILRDNRKEVARITAPEGVVTLSFSRDGHLLAIHGQSSLLIVESLTGRRIVGIRVPQMQAVSFERNGLVGYGWKQNDLVGWNLERNLST